MLVNDGFLARLKTRALQMEMTRLDQYQPQEAHRVPYLGYYSLRYQHVHNIRLPGQPAGVPPDIRARLTARGLEKRVNVQF